MVTLVELSSALGSDLVSADGGTIASRLISGVHISELEDPTPYLDGGELLLTTGMPLITDTDVELYVSRLRDRGVPALGVGLGPRISELPTALIEACRRADLDLLVVPDGAPFQNVSRAFWELSARTGRAELMGSLGAQTSLAQAAMRMDATSAVIRGLAEELNGWAAYLPTDSAPASCWPKSAQQWLPALRPETQRLNRAGVHSAATFELDGRPVIEYPIADVDRILGFLAVCPGRRVTAADRQVIQTVCTLLALKHRQRQVTAGVTETLDAIVVKLLLDGQAEAARSVAAEVGLPDLPPRVRILAAQGQGDDDALVSRVPNLSRADGLPALDEDLAATALRYEGSGTVYAVVTDDHLRSRPGESQSAEAGPGLLRAVLSEPVLLSQVASMLPTLSRTLRTAPEGVLVGAEGETHFEADQWVAALAEHPNADVVQTVVAFLRHRGQWEPASRELGLHRNSVRHRIRIAESVLNKDLSDPDVFAPLWLALHRNSASRP